MANSYICVLQLGISSTTYTLILTANLPGWEVLLSLPYSTDLARTLKMMVYPSRPFVCGCKILKWTLLSWYIQAHSALAEMYGSFWDFIE